MITPEEISGLLPFSNKEAPQFSKMTTPDEAGDFRNDLHTLAFMIAERKIRNEIEKHIKPTHGYSDLEECCDISTTSIKKTINGTQKPTRTFLYKFAVGLKMTRAEADEFFALCGGTLRDDCLEDKICINALRDGDDVYSFEDEIERYTAFLPKKEV